MGDSNSNCCNSSGPDNAHLMSHINSLECRLSKQRCWLTLITIIIVAVLAFAAGFMAGRCCANKNRQQCNGGPGAPCPMGANNGSPCGSMPSGGGDQGCGNAMFFSTAVPGPQGVQAMPGMPGMKVEKDVIMKVIGPGGNAMPMFDSKVRIGRKITVDSNGQVHTIDIEDDGEGEDEDEDASAPAPVPPAPPKP